MRRLTVSVPDDVYQRTRLLAAKQRRSVSAIVAEYLQDLAGKEESGFARLEALQNEMLAQITGFNASDRLSRDEIHDRGVR